MKKCKHCNKLVSGSHRCEVAGRTIDTDSDFLTDAIESFFGGDASNCDSGSDSDSDSGSCGGD